LQPTYNDNLEGNYEPYEFK